MAQRIFYSLFASHHLTTILLRQDIIDFNPNKGYAAKPGYIENCWKVFRGEKELILSGFTVCRGHRLDNFVEGTVVHQYFLSCQFAEVLEAEAVTGYLLRNEDVKNTDGKALCYKRLIITGRCGRTEKLDEFQVTQPRTLRCHNLPEDGLDFFLPPNHSNFFCSERVVKIIKKHKLRVSSIAVEFA